jgi:hypothetical protein
MYQSGYSSILFLPCLSLNLRRMQDWKITYNNDPVNNPFLPLISVVYTIYISCGGLSRKEYGSVLRKRFRSKKTGRRACHELPEQRPDRTNIPLLLPCLFDRIYIVCIIHLVSSQEKERSGREEESLRQPTGPIIVPGIAAGYDLSTPRPMLRHRFPFPI